MNNTINLALQIIPKSKEKDIYSLVDEAIAVIRKSGIKYQVCPFETVMEGTYDQLMKIIKDAQDACLNAGAEEVLVYVKIQRKKAGDVRIEDKMEKYS